MNSQQKGIILLIKSALTGKKYSYNMSLNNLDYAFNIYTVNNILNLATLATTKRKLETKK